METRIKSPIDAVDLLRTVAKKNREHLGLILLDSQFKVIGKKVLFVGSVNRCWANRRELLVYALRRDAVGCILFHNHPSGNTEPSDDDKKMTEDFFKGCEAVGIYLFDHIIVSKTRYSSFKELGILPESNKEANKGVAD